MSPHFTTLEGEFGPYRLSVIGADDAWFWCVSLGNDDLDEGRERTLEAAIAAVEAAALKQPQPRSERMQ